MRLVCEVETVYETEPSTCRATLAPMGASQPAMSSVLGDPVPLDVKGTGTHEYHMYVSKTL